MQETQSIYTLEEQTNDTSKVENSVYEKNDVGVSKEEIIELARVGFEQYGFKGEVQAFRFNEPKYDRRPNYTSNEEYFPRDIIIDGKPLALAGSIYSKVKFSNGDRYFILAHQRYNEAYFPTRDIDRKKQIEVSRTQEFKGDLRSTLDGTSSQWAETLTINENGILRTYAKYTDGRIKMIKSKALNSAQPSQHRDEQLSVLTLAQFDAISGEIMKVVYTTNTK